MCGEKNSEKILSSRRELNRRHKKRLKGKEKGEKGEIERNIWLALTGVRKNRVSR